MIGIIKKITAKQVGFTLIETLIAVSMFSVVIVIALDSFVKIIKLNRQSVQAQELQDNMRFLYELMSKEIKMAIKDDGSCRDFFRAHIDKYANDLELSENLSMTPASKVYSTVIDNNGNNVLFFKNYRSQCVIYYLENDRLKISRQNNSASGFGLKEGDEFVLPAEINVLKLSVDVAGNFELIRHVPYSVAVYMHLRNINWDPSDFDIQTVVSARYLE